MLRERLTAMAYVDDDDDAVDSPLPQRVIFYLRFQR